MQKTFAAVTVAALVGFAGAANAADMYSRGGMKDAPVAPVATTWAGFYAGVNGGYAWGDNNPILYRDTGGQGSTIPSLEPSGGFGGGQFGYNWQGFSHPNLVLGFEVDIQGADLSDDFSGNLTTNRGATDVVRASQQIDYFGTVRGRLGYASDKTLVYATGGFAYGNVKNHIVVNGFNMDSDDTQTGWVAGGGIEYKLAPAWSLKAEYQYIDLGSKTITETVSGLPITARDVDAKFSTIRVGLNYHMVPSYEPLK
jgi:outer membrane immunogenic protein